MKIGDIIGIIVILGATHFAMWVLIKAELKINPEPIDGFLLRWKATYKPVLLLIAAIVLAYGFYFPGYHITFRPPPGDEGIFLITGTKILIVFGISFPAVIYNLLSYQKDIS